MNHTKLIILFEDTHIIVCKKPAGIATQTKQARTLDLESLIKRHLYEASKREPYLAVIHRLDQPVSGILVFAKTPAAAKSLNQQMQQNGFGKYYKALLTAKPKECLGVLTDYMKKDGRTNTSSICSAKDPQGKRAILNYEIVSAPSENDWNLFSHCDYKNKQDVTMVKIVLDTGRHHQIRVQMANLGCSILGDTKYGTTPSAQSQWQHIALCAYKLEFTHPFTKEHLAFQL